jgi:hypothetical protein
LVAETLVDSSLFFLALSFLASVRLAVRDFFSMDMRRSFLDPRHYTALAPFERQGGDALHLAPVESVSHAVGTLTFPFSEHKQEGGGFTGCAKTPAREGFGKSTASAVP